MFAFVFRHGGVLEAFRCQRCKFFVTDESQEVRARFNVFSREVCAIKYLILPRYCGANATSKVDNGVPPVALR